MKGWVRTRHWVATVWAIAATATCLPTWAASYNGGPANYLQLVAQLRPGDVLELASGTYTEGLPIYSLNGTPDQPIIIRGPSSGPRAIFLGSNSANTVRIWESSYVEIFNLELNGMGRAGDGVNADGRGDWAHHITIDNFLIYGHDAEQGIVGISTNGCTTWGWVIRNNVITGAGTGMYLGNSPGTNPFIGGLIEHNVVLNTRGYNVEIKHQNSRPAVDGIPSGPHKTIIRHNVFSKASNGSTGGNARPNLLVGHFPLNGDGSQDSYEIYGNLFYQNPTEALFQGEGNIGLYANLFVNDSGTAVSIQAHNDRPRQIRVFRNTVLASGTGISVSGADPAFDQAVIANAVFATTPLAGGRQLDNVTGSRADASGSLNAPDAPIGSLDLVPKPGALKGTASNPAEVAGFTAGNLDFEGRTFDPTFRGAYSLAGGPPAWKLALARKPVLSVGVPRPAAPNNLRVN